MFDALNNEISARAGGWLRCILTATEPLDAPISAGCQKRSVFCPSRNSPGQVGVGVGPHVLGRLCALFEVCIHIINMHEIGLHIIYR